MHAYPFLRWTHRARRTYFVLAPIVVISILVAGLGGVRTAYADYDTRRVALGETMVDIAFEYNTTPETIRWLNNLSPTEPLWNGMTLKVPPADDLVMYTVRKGDTPAAVAIAHGMALAQLVDYNEISPVRPLHEGDILLVNDPVGLWLTSEYPHHMVEAGETLDGLAEQYRADPVVIAEVNGIRTNAELVPGTVLLLPPLGLSQRLGRATRDANGYLQIPIEDFPTLTEKWVDVDLSHQRVTAYEGTRPVESFLISSGKSRTPTVTGVFRIWAKISSQTMEGGSYAAGDYYNLPGVQWVSYFYKDYSFHGTYWHHNFGTPMSHGCINMTNADAKWIYDWMGPQNPGRGWFPTPADLKGNLVVVHR